MIHLIIKVTGYLSRIVSICLSRLMLGLRQAYLSDASSIPMDSMSVATHVRFTPCVVPGNSGAPVDLELALLDGGADIEDMASFSHDPLAAGFAVELRTKTKKDSLRSRSVNRC